MGSGSASTNLQELCSKMDRSYQLRPSESLAQLIVSFARLFLSGCRSRDLFREFGLASFAPRPWGPARRMSP